MAPAPDRAVLRPGLSTIPAPRVLTSAHPPRRLPPTTQDPRGTAARACLRFVHALARRSTCPLVHSQPLVPHAGTADFKRSHRLPSPTCCAGTSSRGRDVSCSRSTSACSRTSASRAPMPSARPAGRSGAVPRSLAGSPARLRPAILQVEIRGSTIRGPPIQPGIRARGPDLRPRREGRAALPERQSPGGSRARQKRRAPRGALQISETRLGHAFS
jgi:hypothetical protein